MQLDHSLIKEMYNAGMTLQEIKIELAREHKDYKIVSIAQLRKICQSEIKEREGKSKKSKNNPDNYENITAFGRQVKIRKQNSESDMPTEILDKIQENSVLIEMACSTCSLKPAPGRPCAWPAGMCQMGHIKPLTYNPVELLEEMTVLRQTYKRLKEESNITKMRAASKTRSTKSIFEDDEPELDENGEKLESLEELESEISMAGKAMSAHERIGAALKSAKETEDKQYTEIDNFQLDNYDDIDDQLASVEMSMPSDFADEDFSDIDNFDEIELESLDIDE